MPGDNGYDIMKVTFVIFIIPTLVYLLFTAGLSIKPQVVKSMGAKGITLSVVPFLVEAFV